MGWSSGSRCITYKDSEGNEVTQDLGYGFIGTEEHFGTSVPNETDKILVNVESDIVSNNALLESYSVSFDGKTYENGEAIPPEVGVNKLTVTCNGTYGKSRTYTIDVTRVPLQNRQPLKFQKEHPYL